MRKNVKLALIQQHATENIKNNIERGINSFKEAVEQGANLICFAELAFTPFYPQYPAKGDIFNLAETIPGKTTEIFSELAEKHKVVAVLNLFEKKANKTYDSSPVIDSDGSILGITRMMHSLDAPYFHESGYYTPADADNTLVYNTAVGKVGVAICYDRHFPEYMRALALKNAEIVIIPQANLINEFHPGVFEAEMQSVSFQNGYFIGLCNRVGKEQNITFEGKSFVTAPNGRIIAQSPQLKDHVLLTDIDLEEVRISNARNYYLNDRRPDVYKNWFE